MQANLFPPVGHSLIKEARLQRFREQSQIEKYFTRAILLAIPDNYGDMVGDILDEQDAPDGRDYKAPWE